MAYGSILELSLVAGHGDPRNIYRGAPPNIRYRTPEMLRCPIIFISDLGTLGQATDPQTFQIMDHFKKNEIGN